MDEIAKYNRDRWEELAGAGVAYSLPELDLDEQTAREMVDPEGFLGDVAGKDVLCLAGGGGQQSAAFGILGADVTVLDLSKTQLARDREAADHYGLNIESHQGDMRELSRIAPRVVEVAGGFETRAQRGVAAEFGDVGAHDMRPFHPACSPIHSHSVLARPAWPGRAGSMTQLPLRV